MAKSLAKVMPLNFSKVGSFIFSLLEINSYSLFRLLFTTITDDFNSDTLYDNDTNLYTANNIITPPVEVRNSIILIFYTYV